MSNLGLSESEAKKLLDKFGENDVLQKERRVIRKFILPLFSPISLMLLGAAVLSFFNKKIFDFYFILFLYFVNYFVQKFQEFKADKAIEKIRDKLSFDVTTLRDGKWQKVSAKLLVPGDKIKLGLGSTIPADCELTWSKNLTVNEAILTGESMPKEKKDGDKVFSGSFVMTGVMEAIVEATGKNTSFGKTIFAIDKPRHKSALEKDILSISRTLTIISLVAVAILTVVFFLKHFSINDLLTLDLTLVIAGIPIALPTVMAVILSIGASGLAKRMVIVRRLSALEDLADVDMLLTDKTGTLTKNEINIVDVVSYKAGIDTDRIMELAGYAASKDNLDAIDLAIVKKLEGAGITTRGEVKEFIPYDSDRKRTTALVDEGGNTFLVSLGASQVIESFSKFASAGLKDKFESGIRRAADGGYRVLALALKDTKTNDERDMEIIGMLLLADPLDESAAGIIHFINERGIEVKMLTGDNKVIAGRTAKELGLNGSVISGKEIETVLADGSSGDGFKNTAAFAEILPEDKYRIVEAARGKYVVAVTGDGINDFPAFEAANVGIAVSGSVSALKSAADIVLLDKGLEVIKNAILESRKIFVRLYNYSVYRISESFRLIVSILVLGLWLGIYPLLPLQLIVLALLNDIPIISLAVDRVKVPMRPTEIKTRKRFVLSMLFGSVGLLNSLLFFFIMSHVFNYSLESIQTMFFLKLTVSGHMLIFVAHTKERWFKFLPSKQVIVATVATQIVATGLALTGFLMPVKISLGLAILVWIWAFFWMQVGEFMKDVQKKFFDSSLVV